MDGSNENSMTSDRVEQLERMLKLYMHEVSHLSLAINHSVHLVKQGFIKQTEATGDTDNESRSNNLPQDRIGRSLDDISDSVEMMNFLRNNIRISMSLSITDDEWRDVQVYKEVIFKFKNMYQHELRMKSLGFITPKVTYVDDATISFKTSKYLLEQAIHNLLNNAIKFSHQGTNIYVECKQTAPDSNSRMISIVDYGACIEESDRPYDLFYRGKESALTEGAGLGLFVAKKCIEQLGGQIKHRCKLISDFYVPFIGEYVSRQFDDPVDRNLVDALIREMNHLQQQGIYDRIVSHQQIANIYDEEIRSSIYFQTYETSFEVII